jgi:hypothetical protein
MADTHEEQLLSELLGEIARDDAGLDAPHLETRVLASVPMQAAERPRRSRVWILLPAAAVVLMAVTVRLKPDAATVPVRQKPYTTTMPVRQKPDTTTMPIRQKPDTATTARAREQNGVRSVRLQPDRRPDREDSPMDAPVSERSPMTSSIEFVPLMPITEHELTGSFQIVRVQMPSASLGALRSPLTEPNEIVEADVLLGEDGRARAIRVNANQSIYPWRPR